ncbi:hypothetical protein AB0B31_11560 [Catellatospora citrea]|uniref:hypothetical protein n=1 Tax=Catellatospora citrea TaxID=53366 RepID=UPI0033E285F3
MTDALTVRGPNGGIWTRKPGGRSTAADLLREIDDLLKNHIEREWDWWQEGRRDQERERQQAVLADWDNGAKSPPGFDPKAAAKKLIEDLRQEMEDERLARQALADARYDKDRESKRLQMLTAEADAAFFDHVVQRPASPAQRDEAEQRSQRQRALAVTLREQLGDPEDVVDSDGFLPAQRREMNVSSHMSFWRYPMLRGLHQGKQRKRFNALLSIRPIEADEMCSECQAPSYWHSYALSLCLFRGKPEPGSQAAELARMIPGWWDRCSACTTYQTEHVWGGSLALPDFDGQQWAAMLPPVLKAIFVPDPPKPRQRVVRPKPLAVINAGTIDDAMAKLAEAKSQFPDAVVRSGSNGSWELWPPA